ncbi:hypothetical protein K501DRAFT_258040 [Backusella circina FSU 941]|nr:hypothetical protein K501DRAFT_258040 [Backusella circina FSU 941]
MFRVIDDDIGVLFDAFATFYSAIIPVFNGSGTCYQVETIKYISNTLVTLAFEADKAHQLQHTKSRKADTAARLLSKTFNIMLADRSSSPDQSKRLGIFHVTNLAFRVYFRLNSIRMCQTFISNIDSGGVILEHFPISQQVTYRYYLGRYALLQGQLKKAKDNLWFAFNHCHAEQYHNKRVILHYMIPTMLILGHFPSHTLLEKYQLTEQFSTLLHTLKCGNVAGYLAHLEQHVDYFYSKMTYFLLRERGVVLVWRCLIKNIYYQKNVQGNQLTFADCLIGFNYSTKSYLELEDIECLFVSLISQGYIRGYVHHQYQRVILSKQDPFRPISKVNIITSRYDEDAMEDHFNNAQPEFPEHLLQLEE